MNSLRKRLTFVERRGNRRGLHRLGGVGYAASTDAG
jgi:hypothetical protein